MGNDGQASSSAAGDAKSALLHRPETEVRQLHFRDDCALGTLFYRRHDDGHLVWAFLSEARGLVTMPRAYEVVLTTEITDEPLDLAPLAAFQADALHTIDFMAHPLDDAELVALEGLIGLRELNLGGTGISDAGVRHLQYVTGLRSLDLRGTAVTDRSLAYVGQLANLEELYLSATHITDAGLRHLRALVKLRDVHLSDPYVSSEGAGALARVLPDCMILHGTLANEPG